MFFAFRFHATPFMKASVGINSPSASHIADKSLVAFESLEAVEYYVAFQPFTKHPSFQAALQGYAPFSLFKKINIRVKNISKQKPNCNVSYNTNNITFSQTSVEVYLSVTPTLTAQS